MGGVVSKNLLEGFHTLHPSSPQAAISASAVIATSVQDMTEIVCDCEGYVSGVWADGVC